VNVGTRLRGAFAIYIALLAGLSIYHVRTTKRTVTAGRAVTAIAVRLFASSIQLERIQQISRDAEKFLFLRGDRDYLANVQKAMAEYDADLRRIDTLSLRPREQAVLVPLVADWEQAKLLAATLGGKQDSVVAAEFQRSLDRVHTGTQTLAAASQSAMEEELDEAEKAELAAEKVTLIAAGGAVLLSLILSALVARSILEPLKQLTKGTREVSAGHFAHRLTPAGSDELAQLSREFNVMTERLDELDRMKREFVSKVSHDLKTPLSSMQETNSVLLDGVPGPLTPKQRQLLEITQDSAQRLSTMLNKLLDLSRLEAGLQPERQTIDVRPIVRQSVERVKEGAAGPRVSLSSNDAASALLIRGNADDLSQVFDNLLENALKFSPFDGNVRVCVSDRAARGEVLVTVADDGPGIPDEEKLRVFGRFYQTEAGRGVRSRGVGLGLSICQEIVNAHGGTIWVTDNEPRGSVFHVRLPKVNGA
jgi:signal transduction histidine kinase